MRVMGLHHEPQFQNYHRVLNRAVWSSRQASRLLLQQLVAVFAPSGVLVMGIDDTIERRWGKRIAARGIYRDPVRSSHSHLVKTSGLRWLSLMLRSRDSLGTTGLGTAVFHRFSAVPAASRCVWTAA